MPKANAIRYLVSRTIRAVVPLRWLRDHVFPGKTLPFKDSRQYWNERYARGGNSGEGSYGPLAKYKADFINHFAAEHGISSAVEFGCGDGNQAAMFNFECYLGLDINQLCIGSARKALARPGWQFQTMEEYHLAAADKVIDLALSLDVTYHLIEDEAYTAYLNDLFGAAERYVLIYASDLDHFDPAFPHVRHRPVVKEASERFSEWRFVRTEKNPYYRDPQSTKFGSFAQFHVFEKRA